MCWAIFPETWNLCGHSSFNVKFCSIRSRINFYRCSALPTKLTRPAESWSLCWFVINRHCRSHGFKSCTGLNVFRPYFHYCLSSVHYCEDRFHIYFLNRNSHIWFSYVHNFSENIFLLSLLIFCHFYHVQSWKLFTYFLCLLLTLQEASPSSHYQVLRCCF